MALTEQPRAQDVRAALPPEVTAVRVTYADLHGVQRGKDVPSPSSSTCCDHGLAFCWAVMGTDLRHTPVVGGELGYPDMVARPDLATLVAAAVGAGRRASCLADLERAIAHEPEPTDPRGAVRRAVGGVRGARLAPSSAPSSSSSCCSPTSTRPAGGRGTSTTCAWSTRSARRPTPRGRAHAAGGLRGARAGRVRGQPRVHEQPVRDQPARVGRRSTPPTAPSA